MNNKINIADLLQGSDLQGKDGMVAPNDVLANKVVGIYFSAHWCPPCQGFTPILSDFYQKLKLTGASIEIVFVTSDRDSKSFGAYYNEMPWVALPYGDDRIAKLKTAAGLKFIPHLIFVEPSSGNILTDDGRTVVANDNFEEVLGWCSIK
jgi:nucleoredoxin